MVCKHACIRVAAALCLLTGILFTSAPPVGAHSHNDWQKERAHVKERARSVRGTRYTYGGESPRSGFDCSGFLRWVFGDHGAQLPRRSIDQFYMGGRDGNKRIWKPGKLQPGDLVFFKTTSARVGHAGMFIGHGKFIHSSSAGGGVRIDSIWDPHYYRPRFVGGTRVRATQR
jgi:cell wall-associated NlpC family hydrolase